MHFELAPSEPLRKAFVGFEAWHERGNGPAAASKFTPPFGVSVHRPEQTFDGLTLYTSIF